MEQEQKETRIKKWMKYREEILENNNIRISLINTNPEFQKQHKKLYEIFNNIDFSNNENDNFLSRVDFGYFQLEDKILDIDKKLEEINTKERAQNSSKNESVNFNSNKYDSFLKKYFLNEYNKDKSDSIKVTKIDLGKKA